MPPAGGKAAEKVQEAMKKKRRADNRGGFWGGMGETFGFGGKYTNYMSRIFDALLLGLCWILCSLPVFTIGISSCALYYSIVKCVKQDRGHAVSDFFSSFRKNFRQGTILWLPDLAVLALMFWNIHILVTSSSKSYLFLFLTMLYGMIFVFVLLGAVYEFAALSRFVMPSGWFIRFAAYAAVRHLGTSLALLVIFAMFGILAYRFPLLVFAMPGACVFLISEFTEKILHKYSPDCGGRDDPE